MSPDGKSAYVPSLQSDAVAVFKRQADDDADGAADPTDNCPGLANFDQLNSDGDANGRRLRHGRRQRRARRHG